jgi:hypothetical protein
MKTVFKIFGQEEVNVVTEVILGEDGLNTDLEYGKVLFQPLDFQGFTNEFTTELEALEQLQKMDNDGFFETWGAFEIKRLFIK